MDELSDYINDLIDRYRRQPGEWQAWAADISLDKFGQVPAGQGWSAHQVFAHVMAADEFALQPRLNRIMTEERPQLPNWDEESWMATSYDSGQSLTPGLSAWDQSRQQLAFLMAELPMAAWNRTGLHPLHGERTLLWWLEYAVGHVNNHVGQLQEILANDLVE